MTTVAIMPVASAEGAISYQAVSGCRIAAGSTAGEALDALVTQFPEVDAEPLVVIQRFRPDQFFSSNQQLRLQELMMRWRFVRDGNGGGEWSEAEQAELESLIDAEVAASAKRAAESAQRFGR